jgi:uncharacterized integral membrane protein
MIKVVYFVSITLLIINLVFAIINFETLNLVLFISQSFVLFAIAVISNTAIKNEGIREELIGFRDYYFESTKEKEKK